MDNEKTENQIGDKEISLSPYYCPDIALGNVSVPTEHYPAYAQREMRSPSRL